MSLPPHLGIPTSSRETTQSVRIPTPSSYSSLSLSLIRMKFKLMPRESEDNRYRQKSAIPLANYKPSEISRDIPWQVCQSKRNWNNYLPNIYYQSITRDYLSSLAIANCITIVTNTQDSTYDRAIGHECSICTCANRTDTRLSHR